MEKSKRLENLALKQIAGFMCVAARTAPKAKGADNILTLVIDNKQKKTKLVEKMLQIAKNKNMAGFKRDAKNINLAPVIVLIATKIKPAGLAFCGFCGYKDCSQLQAAKAICAFNPIDLGIAAGSAVDVASSFHVDNRIMYSLGKAALELDLFKDKSVKIALGIPLSASGKNPFFDRVLNFAG
ncbi:MAG: DUF2148 domain-containing protein [Candidatus Omnitrophota bacterium]